jgi:CubicO group peptidase (beta-lactamase class C family)
MLGGASLAPLIRTARGAEAQPGPDGLPVTGRALPGLDALDGIVTPIMRAHANPGAAIAIAHAGALKVARGYGYADLQARSPMTVPAYSTSDSSNRFAAA